MVGIDAVRPRQLSCHRLVLRESGNFLHGWRAQAHCPQRCLRTVALAGGIRECATQSHRAEKINEARAREIIAQNERWTILVDTMESKPRDLLSLSLAYGLSSYDAAYLDLAIRLRLPIAAKDGALLNAAGAAGIGVVAV